MTTIAEFNSNPCPKWDATDVNAYFDLSLDPSNLTRLVLDNSWGGTAVDLTPAVKAGETITHLMLDPTDVPVYLRYDNEAGDSECIHGDALSRIISMRYLKDVDQNTGPIVGDVYMLGDNNLFYTHNLAEFEQVTNDRLASLEGRMASLEGRVLQVELDIADIKNVIQNLGNRLTAIENAIFDWDNDKNTKIPRGNINIISDYTNSDNRNWGIFTHDKNNLIANDEFFA